MRNALGGKAGGNSYGKTYDFHDVTIVFTGLTVTLKLHGCTMYAAKQNGRRGPHLHFLA